MDRWMDRSSLPGKPRPSFSHSPPSLCSPHMCLISLPRRSHVWLGDPDSTPDRLFSRAWQIWLAGRRRSHPLENTEFCPHCSLSFKIPPPDVFQASHFTGVTRQQGLFLTPPPLDSCEHPGSISTLTGAPARRSPRDLGDPARPLMGCVTLNRPSLLLGLSFPIWKTQRLSRALSEVVPPTLLLAGHHPEVL